MPPPPPRTSSVSGARRPLLSIQNDAPEHEDTLHAPASPSSSRKGRRRLFLFLSVSLLVVACLVAIGFAVLPSVVRLVTARLVREAQITVKSMFFHPIVVNGTGSNTTMLVTAVFELVHRGSVAVPSLLRPSVRLGAFPALFSGPGAGAEPAGSVVFPALDLDVRAGVSAFTLNLTMDVAGREPAFREFASRMFYGGDALVLEVQGSTVVTVRGTMFRPVVQAVELRKSVVCSGLAGLSTASTSMEITRADSASALALVTLSVINNSSLSAVLLRTGFDIFLDSGGSLHYMGSAAVAGGRPLVLAGPGETTVSLEVALAPKTSQAAGLAMATFLSGAPLPLATFTTFSAVDGVLGWALAGVRVNASTPEGSAPRMFATLATVVGGTNDTIIANVSYTIDNPSGFVSGRLDAVALGVWYSGSRLGQTVVTDISLANSNFSQLVHMTPGNLTTVAQIGALYIAQSPFTLSFSGIGEGGPMSMFFTGWHDSLLVAGSPTALVQKVLIESFRVEVVDPPPSYAVLAGAVLLNPLPFTLTMTGISFTARFNDTHGEKLGPIVLYPPEDNISMGRVTMDGLSVALPSFSNLTYSLWLNRTSLELATRLAEVWIVRNDLYLDLTEGLVTVSWFNLTLPFDFKGYYIPN
jgi:hypothetical protein